MHKIAPYYYIILLFKLLFEKSSALLSENGLAFASNISQTILNKIFSLFKST